jgi:anti-sigma factor ChrR (cupin superfamily)
MRHSVAPDEMIEIAASYSLGALSQQEARAFEDHLAEGCQACRDELASFETILTGFAFADEGRAPALKIRDELLARLKEEASGNGSDERGPSSDGQSFISIRASEGDWTEVQDGVFMKQLFVDEASGVATSLVRMQPGTFLPVHLHNGIEQIYVIEGDCSIRGESLGPGDYHRAAAGSIHERTYTVQGTMFLLVAPKSYDVLEAQ